MTDRSELRTWSFLSLLVGGILIVAGGLMGALMMRSHGWAGMPLGGMMDAQMSGPWTTGMTWWMGGVGLLAGVFVLLAAYHVYRERNVVAWSVIAIIAGALSLFAMGGFVLGAIAAISGGALGLLEEQQRAPRSRGA